MISGIGADPPKNTEKGAHMQNGKKVLMMIPHMTGGGAERVAAQLMNRLNACGYDTRFVLRLIPAGETVRFKE